jgi:hypothetical protein
VTEQATPGPGAPPDTLNDVGVLRRREIEARIVGPLLERFAEEFGLERVAALAAEVVIGVARDQGRAMADHLGGNDLARFASSLEAWTRDDALEIEVVVSTEDVFAFHVHRCRYAEMYRALGVPELGALLSCNRDGSLMEGFNGSVEFTRSQTIMGGASHCDFLYRRATPVELTRP